MRHSDGAERLVHPVGLVWLLLVVAVGLDAGSDVDGEGGGAFAVAVVAVLATTVTLGAVLVIECLAELVFLAPFVGGFVTVAAVMIGDTVSGDGGEPHEALALLLFIVVFAATLGLGAVIGGMWRWLAGRDRRRLSRV